MRRIRLIEIDEEEIEDACPGLNGCSDVLKELVEKVSELVERELAGVEPDEYELKELYQIARDLYLCISDGGDAWS